MVAISDHGGGEVGRSMPAQLVSLNDGPSILLDKPIVLVGRHPECDIQIDSRKVSRHHCCIAHVNDYLVVRDLGSTNGIRINGVRVMEGRLKGNDELTIGGSRFRVSWDIAAEAHSRSQKWGQQEELAKWLAPAAANDDHLLESCDEPIPLAEPAGAPVAMPMQKPPAPVESIESKIEMHSRQSEAPAKPPAPKS